VPEFAEDMAAGRAKRMSTVASRALNLTLAYATLCAVFLYSFSEELGYLVYKSYDAGYYISVLAPVVPIMFLDHVTDSMLKGIGEQVFSMWVNISDSLLSVILVCLLIPRMGIMGYAVVIVIMEGYNFLLSFLRLGKKIRFSVSLIPSLKVLTVSILSVALSDVLFRYGGSSSGAIWVLMKMIFAISSVAFLLSFASIFTKKQKSALCKN
jgi:stage V sporulation protein B